MINPDNPNITNEPRSSTEIEGDIRRTRGRMDATLDELGEHLTARSIVNSALDWWESRTGGPESNASSKAKHLYRSVGRQVKEHPMPSLLIGAGLAWIIVDAAAGEDDDEGSRYPTSARGPSYGGSFERTGHRFGVAGSAGAIQRGNGGERDGGPGLGEKAKQMASQATGAISDAAGAVKNKVSDFGDAAQGALVEQSRSFGRNVSRTMQSGYRTGTEQMAVAIEEYPLAVGVGFAALGVLAGLLLPRTQREDRMFGEQSDELVEAAKEKGKDLLDSGKVIAERVGEVALNEAKNQGLTADAGEEKVSDLASKAGEVVRKVKDEAIAAAKDEGLTPDFEKRESGPQSAT